MPKRNKILQYDGLNSNEVRLLLDSLKVAVDQVFPTLEPHGSVKLAKSLSLLQRAIVEIFEAYLKSIQGIPDHDFVASSTISGFVGHINIIHEKYLGYLVPTSAHSFPVNFCIR